MIATVGTIRESDELCVYAAVRIGQQLGNVRLRTWPISSLATWAHAGADDDAQDDGEAEAEAMLAAVAAGHQPRAMHRRDTMRVSDRDGRFAEIVPVVDEATGALAGLTVRWELISKVGVGQINIDLSFDDDGTATAAVDIVSEVGSVVLLWFVSVVGWGLVFVVAGVMGCCICWLCLSGPPRINTQTHTRTLTHTARSRWVRWCPT